MKWFWKPYLTNKTFYKKYKDAQIGLNVKKFKVVWVYEQEIEKISRYILNNISNTGFGLCHGSRNGAEVRFFNKYLPKFEVLGTDISHTAGKVENMIVWDFHGVKEEWVGNVDFIYTNSFDHTYDPYKCLKAWLSCLSDNGVCFIHVNPISMKKSLDGDTNGEDCFSADNKEMVEIISSVGNIVGTIDLFKDRKNDRFAYIINKKRDV